MATKFIELNNLEVYKLAGELSNIGWRIYEDLDWQTKKVMGDQFIQAVDSIGANIAESYGRFHYLDKIKFLYNSRGSFNEANYHWLELLYQRGRIRNKEYYQELKQIATTFSIKLNNYISSTYKAKKNYQTQ